MEMNWESIVNDIIANKDNKRNTVVQEKEIRDYIAFIAKQANGPAVALDIDENFDGILWMYKRLTTAAEEHNISWSDETKFDVDLYTGMIFSAYYLQKAWGTVSDTPPPVDVARVIGYALIVGYRLGIMGGQHDEL